VLVTSPSTWASPSTSTSPSTSASALASPSPSPRASLSCRHRPRARAATRWGRRRCPVGRGLEDTMCGDSSSMPRQAASEHLAAPRDRDVPHGRPRARRAADVLRCALGCVRSLSVGYSPTKGRHGKQRTPRAISGRRTAREGRPRPVRGGAAPNHAHRGAERRDLRHRDDAARARPARAAAHRRPGRSSRRTPSSPTWCTARTSWSRGSCTARRGDTRPTSERSSTPRCRAA